MGGWTGCGRWTFAGHPATGEGMAKILYLRVASDLSAEVLESRWPERGPLAEQPATATS